MATSTWRTGTQRSIEPQLELPDSTSSVDVSVRKRMEVGLAPRRPTANSAPQRPPDAATMNPAEALLPVFLGMILAATMLLVAANIGGWFPNWWRGPAVVADTLRAVSVPLGGSGAYTDYQMALKDDFSGSGTVFAEGASTGEWRVAHTPTASSYLMEVWPNHVVWSLLELDDASQYRTQASMSVATHTPWGFAGLINRYSDDQNFYLFMVDGKGRYTVQMQQDGSLMTLQEWTASDVLNRAGSTNTLTVDDNGNVQRFYGNNMLLYEGPTRLPAGDAGLAGGAFKDGVAEISFDWVQLFDLLTD